MRLRIRKVSVLLNAIAALLLTAILAAVQEDKLVGKNVPV
jgi:hypothetical protein